MLDYSSLACINKHVGKIKILVLFLALLPLLILIIEFHSDDLGIDPLDRLTRLTGYTALVLLTLSLTITPLRHFMTLFMVGLKANYGKRLADWNWVIKLRRLIGVMSFVYAFIHFVIYFWLDQGANFYNAFYDIKERNFIAVGLTAFILLIPLAATSTNRMMRLLGKKWRRLHRSVYLISIFAVIHFWMLSKVAVYDYMPYVVITFFLLGWRVWYYWTVRKDKLFDDGMEAIDREQVNRIVKNLNYLSEKTFGADEGPSMTSMLFNILASDKHFSESILKRNKNIDDELNVNSQAMVKRLKQARNNVKENIGVQSILGVQAGHMPDLLELVEKIDTLLMRGIEAERKGDKLMLDKVWSEIFSKLMPVF